ncbi:MAG: YdeI family protein [Planctomycetota bacterium]
MATTNRDVDAFLRRAPQWQDELRTLRAILLDCGLDESLKWGKPCYASSGRNLAILQPFKAHCALMFFQGALLDDTHGLLRSQGPNSRSALRLEFTAATQIRKTVVRSYVKQAIAVAQSGREVAPPAVAATQLPEELRQALAKDRELARAFRALTPGRQRGYVLHFTGAKQSKTRVSRIEKCVPGILAGKGIDGR